MTSSFLIGLRRLSPAQLGLTLGIVLLTIMIGVLVFNLYFDIIATNVAFEAGYIITDLTDIQRSVLLLQYQHSQTLDKPSPEIDFAALELNRALLTSHFRLALTEAAANPGVLAGLSEMQASLTQYDSLLAVLKANPSPAQLRLLKPEMDGLLEALTRQSKNLGNREENIFFNSIGKALRSQRSSQTILLILSGLFLLLSLMFILSLQRTLTDRFSQAYHRLVQEVTERRQAEKELRQSHTQLHLANQHLQTLNQQLQDELALAHKIQQSILPPPFPNWPGLDVVCYSVPARELGGDFYAYRARGDGHFMVAVGDVSGKGLPAALLMATSVAHFDSILDAALPPAETLSQLSRALIRYTKTTRQNCALCYLEIDGLTLHVANAGGIPPYIRRATGGVEALDVGGLPLGVGLGLQNNYNYQALSVSLLPRDLVILTSDGVAEANITTDHLFGFPRLEQAIANGPITNAQAMLEHLQYEVHTFIGKIEPPDDLTIVVLQIGV